MSEIACAVQHRDDLHELLIVADAVDEAVALIEHLADRILVAGFRDGAAAARQGGEALDGEDQPLGELGGVEGGVLRDVVAQLRELALGADCPGRV